MNHEKFNNNYDAMLNEYAPLVKRIAHHLLGRLPPCVQVEDLIQAGMIGLLEAYKNFDESKGASFTTYAGIRIRGSMLDEIRKGDWAPRSVHRNSRKISEAIRVIENDKNRDARDFEVAALLNISLGEYHTILADTNATKVFGFSDLGVKEDLIANGMQDNNNAEPLRAVERDDFKQVIAKSIATLPERERLVLALYYDEEMNLKEVGEVLGVSESRISQIHSQAMHRLQSRLGSEGA